MKFEKCQGRKKEETNDKISLDEIASGALQEKFDKAFERVIENLSDPNTSFKESRAITITMKFSQNERRDDVVCDISVKEKLAAQAATRTAFAFGKNLKTGEIFTEEYGRNQMSIHNLDADKESEPIVDEATTRNSAPIIDMRKVNFN